MIDILNYFPSMIKIKIEENIVNDENYLEEIRIRNSKKIILKYSNMEKIIDYCVSENEILECLQKICENSIYSYQKEIAEGFITVKGGHRVGIVGTCVISDGSVINIKYISSLNFRIARQVINCSDEVINYILKQGKNTIYNTLIVAPPCSRENNNFERYSKKDFKWYRRCKLLWIKCGIS